MKTIKNIIYSFGATFYLVISPLVGAEQNQFEINVQKLREFNQNQDFMRLSPDEKQAFRHENQKYLETLYNLPHINKDFISFHVVENIIEVDQVFSQLPLQNNHKRIIFSDIDETLLFTNTLGWIDNLLNEIVQGDPSISYDLYRCCQDYKLGNIQEFRRWGQKLFLNLPEVKIKCSFLCQKMGVHPENAMIFKKWYESGADIYAFTGRNHKDDGVLNATSGTLAMEGIHLRDLHRIPFESGSTFGDSSYYHQGVLYDSEGYKFAESAVGYKFLDAYLTQLQSGNNLPDLLEIDMIDESQMIMFNIFSADSMHHLQELQSKFNIKVHFKAFMPYQWNWLSPIVLWNNSNGYKDLPEEKREHIDTAFRVFSEFIKYFKSL